MYEWSIGLSPLFIFKRIQKQNTMKKRLFSFMLSIIIDGGDGVPCYLRVGAGETSYWDSAHFVIGVGHTAGATSTSGSIRVNSGWVSLGYVYIGTSIPSHIVN